MRRQVSSAESETERQKTKAAAAAAAFEARLAEAEAEAGKEKALREELEDYFGDYSLLGAARKLLTGDELDELRPLREELAHAHYTKNQASRSLGDTLAKECGVTAQPHITQVTLGAQDRFLVLASGGVWKVFSPNEVVDLVSQQPDAAAAADAVLKEASTRWVELWQGENTSVMIVAFPTA